MLTICFSIHCVSDVKKKLSKIFNILRQYRTFAAVTNQNPRMRKVLQGLTYAGVLAFSPSVFADIPSTYVFEIDSLHTTQIQLTKATDFSTPTGVTSQLVLQRLEALQTTVEVFVDTEVMQHVYAFTTYSPQSTSFLLQRQAFYFSTFEQILQKHGIPQELKYLAVIESGLVPEATSYVAAAGLWQLMPSTAAGLGLKQNEWLDERLDPVKSTEAAARYLKYLHHMFGDWKLVMGAYNCGEGVMLQAIQAAGGKYDWDSVAPFLPAQTRAYLPKFMAMLYVLNYAPQHGIGAVEPWKPIVSDTIALPKAQSLHNLAEVLDVPLATLKLLNPHLRKGIAPKYYPIRVPKHSKALFQLLPETPTATTAAKTADEIEAYSDDALAKGLVFKPQQQMSQAARAMVNKAYACATMPIKVQDYSAPLSKQQTLWVRTRKRRKNTTA